MVPFAMSSFGTVVTGVGTIHAPLQQQLDISHPVSIFRFVCAVPMELLSQSTV
jgi:hypothetical protein